VNLGTYLIRSALWFADRTAIIHEGHRFTFRQLNERVNRLANAFLELGLPKGDRVALLSANRHELVEADFACYKTGLARVPLNARLSMPELIHMLNNSESKVLILGPEFIDGIERVRSEIPMIRYYIALSQTPRTMVNYETLLQGNSPEEPKVEVGIAELCSLNYTSGTTGKLKAAMMSHRNRICQAKKFLLIPDVDIRKDSVMCHVGPITHASGGMILPFIIQGACNLILRGFDVKGLLETIQKEKVTHLFTVPTMLNFMMAYPDLRKYDLSSIQMIMYGASPMPVERIKQALEVFGPVLVQGYGQTETTSGFTFLSKDDHLFVGDPKKERRLASAGLPSPECEVRVVNEQGKDVKPGEVGEIIERGDDSMLGYWKDPELTAETLKDGWVYTRDMATVDEEGYIYIVDRKSDMIISGGFNIYPSEVENALHMHPAVFEAAVIAVPDEQWGESVKAIVVLRPGMKASEEEIIEHCKKNLASFKKPKTVDFVPELPKNPYGKVLRRKLREKYWSGQERMVH
jgi:acyl-CoA synthetase (AMP-forming)/AMP-acid ligase II